MRRSTNFIIKFIKWRKRYISQYHFIILTSAFIGLGAGLAAIGLKKLTHHIGELVQSLEKISAYYYLFPFLGILLAILMNHLINREKKRGKGEITKPEKDEADESKHAISDVLFSIFKKSGKISPKKIYSRFITSSLTVGFGGSAGLEAPVVMVGSAMGSNVGRTLLLSTKERILLIGCGSAAVISAIFNAPITGLIFSIEVILFSITLNSFIALLTASLSATLISIFLYEDKTLFAFRTAYEFEFSNTFYFILLGIAMALIAKFFTVSNAWFEKKFEKIPNQLLRYLVGVSLLSLCIYFFPVLYGEGYTTISHILNHESHAIIGDNIEMVSLFNSVPALSILFFLAIIIFKCLAFSFTTGAGGVGGTFAPSLFLGCFGGFAFARAVNILDINVALPETIFALIGMAGVLSATQYAPLTAIFLIAELTGGYDLFVPLMIVSTISYLTVVYFNPDSPYLSGLIKKGHYIKGNRDEKILSNLDIDTLIEKDFSPVSDKAYFKDLIEIIKKNTRNIFPVVDEAGKLVGYITLDFVRDKMFDKKLQDTLKISDIMKKNPSVIYVGEKMISIIDKFEKTSSWNLPVVDNGKYIGFISKSRIFNFYRNEAIGQA